MKPPLIFTHFNYQPYMAYTLAKAKDTNPDRRLILLGDEQNRDVALRSGWEHYLYRDYSGDLQKRFSQSFRPIYGPKRRPYYEQHPLEKSWYLSWLRFVTERWFYIDEFVNRSGIGRFWHFDSDTMILKDLSSVEDNLNNVDYTIQCNGMCLNGMTCGRIVRNFCEHICSLYEDNDFVEAQQAALDQALTDSAFTEMSAFQNFDMTSSYRKVWLMEYSDDIVFDDCLCQSHGFEMATLSDGASVKNISFEDGLAYGLKAGKRVEFITLNLSWLPISVFQWVFAAQSGFACAAISDLDYKLRTVDVSFHEPARPIIGCLRDGEHAHEAALRKLRETFRSTCRILVSFASGFEAERRQCQLATSVGSSGEFHTIESWSYDRIIRTDFFDRNAGVLRRSSDLGFLLWKPFIVSDAVSRGRDGDLVIFSDCTSGSADMAAGSVLPLLSWLSADQRRFAARSKLVPNSASTKRDCFHLMGCDNFDYWHAQQVSTACFAFIVTPRTRKLVADWLNYCCDPRILTDDLNACGLKNLPDFEAHACEQSVLSNLLVRDGFLLPSLDVGGDVGVLSVPELIGCFERKFVASHAEIDSNCISFGKVWNASSNSVWSVAEGTMEANQSDREFFFHTELEDGPWWALDLGAEFYVTKLTILNRPTPPFGARAQRMRVFVGIARDQMEPVFDAATGGWDPYTPLIIRFSPSKMRFIRIALDTIDILHLKDVRVYGVPT